MITIDKYWHLFVRKTLLPVFWSFETYNGHPSDSTDNGNTSDWNNKLLLEVIFHRYFSVKTWRFDVLYEPCIMHVFLYENTANYDVLLCFQVYSNDLIFCQSTSCGCYANMHSRRRPTSTHIYFRALRTAKLHLVDGYVMFEECHSL